MKLRKILFSLFLLVSCSICSFGQAHPNMFLNQDEIDGIKAKIQASQQPWKSGYDQVISEANAALSQGPYSVTYGLGTSHDYYTELPYCGWSRQPPYGDGQQPDCRDGQVNPGADREDYKQAGNLSNALRNLGQAYAFTGDSRYADRAIFLMNKWCLDPDTYMTPQYGGFQSLIELSVTMAGMFYCADMIYNYSGWDASEKAAFLDWVRSFAESGKGWDAENNFENWRLATLSAAGALLDDSSLLNYTFDKFKVMVSRQINSNGQMMPELGRTKSLSYSLYAINAMVQTAEIARHRGVNLFDYTCDGTRGLKFVTDYHAYYAAHPGEWPFQQISGLSKTDNMAMWEITYSFWQTPSHLDAINYWGRPLEEIRNMGWTTLTHANLFELNMAPRVEAPVIIPGGGSSLEPVTITITCATNGAEVRYTTDGSEPTSSSQLYTGSFTISQDTTIKAKAFKSGLEDSYTTNAIFTIGRLVAGGSWQNMSVDSQTSQFTFEFDIKPLATTVNGLAGLSYGTAGAYSDVAAIVRLSPDGVIDVRDGGSYRADSSLPYNSGTIYHVYMNIDVAAKNYSVTVTPEGNSAVSLATDYNFRSEQAGVTTLDNLTIYASQGSHEVSNIVLNGTTPPPPAPLITVIYPNGGEVWQETTTQTITWTSQGTVGNAVGVDLSTDGGSNWTSLASGVPNTGTYQITVPNSPSIACKIRVESVSGTPSDTSNNNFTIEASPDPPSISVDKINLDFGEVSLGNTSTLNFQITNTGGGILSGSISTDKKWIEVQPTSFVADPVGEGNTILVNVTVDNDILYQPEGEYTGTISITSNGGNIDVEVTLVATCVLAKPNPYDPSKGNLTFFGDGIVPNNTTIMIYTLSGELVTELTEGDGKKKIKWNGTNENNEIISNGIYIYTHESPKEKGIGKFTVVRK